MHCVSNAPSVQSLNTVIYDNFSSINQKDWNQVVENKNIYLRLDYLKALEDGLDECRFKYIQFYNAEGMPIGVGYCQIIKITSKEINVDALVDRMGGMLPKSLINSIDMRILICGNAFASGENGFQFNDDISSEDGLSILNNAINEIHLRAKKENNKITITLIKEFWPASFHKIAFLNDKGCSEINIDVNMVLTLSDQWLDFQDYIDAMTSKFRTKAKQVMRKSNALSIIDFDEESIELRLTEIDELYNTIVDRAKFSFGRLNAKTLLLVKKALGDDFFFRGYYLNEKLIGFSTATSFNKTLDGNFIGLDYDFNQEYAVYQRMLYDFVDQGIKRGAKYVNIGRTAEEIKSGVGALPIEMKFYAKHRSKVTNALLKPFLKNLKPNEFNLRKPFKSEYYSK